MAAGLLQSSIRVNPGFRLGPIFGQTTTEGKTIQGSDRGIASRKI